MAEITYAHLKKEDVEAVQALHIQTLSGVPPDSGFYLNMQLVSDCLCLVAKNGSNEMVGFLTARNVEQIVHLLTLAVKEDCRHQKIATTLVQKLVKELSATPGKCRVELHSGGSATALDRATIDAFSKHLGLTERSLPDHLKAENGTIYHGDIVF